MKFNDIVIRGSDLREGLLNDSKTVYEWILDEKWYRVHWPEHVTVPTYNGDAEIQGPFESYTEAFDFRDNPCSCYKPELGDIKEYDINDWEIDALVDEVSAMLYYWKNQLKEIQKKIKDGDESSMTMKDWMESSKNYEMRKKLIMDVLADHYSKSF